MPSYNTIFQTISAVLSGLLRLFQFLFLFLMLLFLGNGIEFCCVHTRPLCKSGLRTGKRPELDRTGLEKNRTAILVFDI